MLNTTAEGINTLARQEQKDKMTAPLYELEADLLVLLDTEETVSEDELLEFQATLCENMTQAIAKRDSVGRFIFHCKSQVDATDAEIKRLQERKSFYAKADEKMREYVKKALEALGTDGETKDGKPKWRKLEGTKFTFSLRNGAAAVKVLDEELVLPRYKRVTLKLPLDLWEDIVFSVPDDVKARLNGWVATQTFAVDVLKTPIKEDLEKGQIIDGVDLVNEPSLVIR